MNALLILTVVAFLGLIFSVIYLKETLSNVRTENEILKSRVATFQKTLEGWKQHLLEVDSNLKEIIKKLQ